MTRDEAQSEIQQMVVRIVDAFSPEKVILFGSYAWGEPSEDSDIDLCVITPTTNPRETARKIDHLLRNRTVPVDILVDSPADLERKIREDGNLFLEDIVKNGVVLYERH